MSRIDKVLLRLARDLKHAPPLSSSWVGQNCQSTDEAAVFCDRLAVIIKGYAQAPTSVRMCIQVCAQQAGPVKEQFEPYKGKSD